MQDSTRKDLLVRRLGIIKALIMFTEHKEEIIKIVFESENTESSKKQLISKYDLNDEQAQTIVDCQVKRLCQLMREDLLKEMEEVEWKLAAIRYFPFENLTCS